MIVSIVSSEALASGNIQQNPCDGAEEECGFAGLNPHLQRSDKTSSLFHESR